jgi:hypothetical protein
MEKNADKIGLGDGIYLATSHKNGILRPVSTGPSIQEQRAAQYAEEQRIAEEQRKAANVKRARQQAQQKIINSGQGISDGYLIWATSNIGASSPYDKGNICSSYYPQGGWRLPSTTELSAFFEKATLTQRPHNGYLRKVYTYNNIVLIGGRYLTSDGYYDVGTNDGLTEVKGYVRLVQLEE